MMKNILIGIVLVVNLSLLFFLKESKNRLQSYRENEKAIIRDGLYLEKRYIKSSTSKINQLDRNIFVYNTEGDSIPLKKLIKSKTLVFAYSKFSCGACVSREMQILNAFIEDHRNCSILVLGNADNFRHLISFQKVNNLKAPIYWI